MAVTATIDKFGMTFVDAYHKVSRLTYESYDFEQISYPSADDPASATPPSAEWVNKKICYFDVETYASTQAREAHAEPIYRINFNFEPNLDAEAADIIVQAYDHLKAQAGYEDAVDC